MDNRLYQKSIIIIALLLTPLAALRSKAQTQQQWKDSLEVLKRQIDKTPYSTDLHLRKAAVNLQLKQWNYAIDEYRLVLEHEPNNLAALFYRAYANKIIRRYDMAYNDYTELLRLCQIMKKQTEAIDHLNRLVEHYPDSASAYVARAVMETDMKQFEPALYDWDEAIRLRPDELDYQLSKWNLLVRMKRKKEAKLLRQELLRKGISGAVLHP